MLSVTCGADSTLPLLHSVPEPYLKQPRYLLRTSAVLLSLQPSPCSSSILTDLTIQILPSFSSLVPYDIPPCSEVSRDNSLCPRKLSKAHHHGILCMTAPPRVKHMLPKSGGRFFQGRYRAPDDTFHKHTEICMSQEERLNDDRGRTDRWT